MLGNEQFLIASKRLSLVAILFAILSGCANNVTVNAEIPAPLVEKLPLTGSMIYNDEFKNYVYLEAEKSRKSLKSLDLAAAQTTLFDQVFGSLMTLVSPEVTAKDLNIEPEILDFQYSAPVETNLKQYEVWIKYRLKLSNADNQKLADWTIKGYGKTPTGLLTSASRAFNSAANVALRDVGAQLSIRFARQRTIKQLLNGDSPEPISEPEEVADKVVEEVVNGTIPAEQLVEAAEETIEETITEEAIVEETADVTEVLPTVSEKVTNED